MSYLEKVLNSDHESLPCPNVHSLPGPNVHSLPGSNVHSCLMLILHIILAIKTYLDGKIATLHKDLAVGHENFATKLKEEVSVKLKGEGNQIQFNFNCDIIADLVKLQKRIPDEDAACLEFVPGAILKVKKRNKLIRIADDLPQAGKPSVNMRVTALLPIQKTRNASVLLEAVLLVVSRRRKYPILIKPTLKATVSAPTASISNQHRVRQNNYEQLPFRICRRREPSSHDICYNCNQLGHWQSQCPLLSEKPVVPGTSRQQS
ncbi:unnamed protein product [Mytilus coruscus]|uniref:CCHC-type domain-containing protein n=1 Tax=Mytilus coruscus TaxID=42192 RepID=A0A6J8AYV5_MYTCO|nr:unnamed protein product [Mytilus coruscus]